MQSVATYVPRKYRIRPALEFLKGRRWYGMWDNPPATDDVANLISAQDRAGLVYACIDVKNWVTKEVKTVVRCARADYVQHRWVFCAPSPSIGLKGGVRLNNAFVQGLTIVTRDEKVTIFVDGSIKREPMNEARNHYG